MLKAWGAALYDSDPMAGVGRIIPRLSCCRIHIPFSQLRCVGLWDVGHQWLALGEGESTGTQAAGGYQGPGPDSSKWSRPQRIAQAEG